jgi:hypothetical protein
MADERDMHRSEEDDASELTRRTVGAADAGTAAAGAAAGALGGAALGPAGALAGGAVGGLAGLLAGSRIRDAPDFSESEDEHYRRLHERTTGAEMPYEHVRDLYRLGHMIGGNPEYGERQWRDIEPEIADAWTAAQRETWGEWREASRYVQRGYKHRPAG